MVKTAKHPSYKNPTIVEALCEIHFRLPEGRDWDPTLFGKVFTEIQKDFPVLEPMSGLRFQSAVGPGGIDQRFIPAEQRMRYKHKGKKKLIQLSKDLMTLNELPKYPGWKVMKKDVLNSWTNIAKVIEPATITRIGLRYINKVDRITAGEKPSEWLKASEFVPKSVLDSLPGFLSRVEVRTGENSHVIVMLGEVMSGPVPEEVPSIVFDIDSIMEQEMKADAKGIESVVEILHESVWKIFNASLTPRLKKVLDGGAK